MCKFDFPLKTYIQSTPLPIWLPGSQQLDQICHLASFHWPNQWSLTLSREHLICVYFHPIRRLKSFLVRPRSGPTTHFSPEVLGRPQLSRLKWLAEVFKEVKRRINITVLVIHVWISQWSSRPSGPRERSPSRQLFLTSSRSSFERK